MTTITQTITALPTPTPARLTQTSDEFVSAMDNLLAALPTMVTQENTWASQANTVAGEVSTNATNAATSATNAATSANAASASAQTALNAPGTSATSTTSLTVGTGTQNLTIQTGKSIVVGMNMVCAYTTTPTTQMRGTVLSYDSGTGALSLSVSSFDGSGTYTAWTVSLTGATLTVDQARTWTTQQTFKELKDTVYTISDGAAFEIDPGNGSIQVVTLGANRTPAATNFEAGQTVLLGIDDGSAYSVTWSTVNPTWVKAGGTGTAPTLATSGYTWILLTKIGSTIFAAEWGKP